MILLCIGYARVHFTHISTDLYLTNTRNKRKLNVRAIHDLSKRPTCGHRYAINLPRPKFDQHLLPCLPIPSTVSLSPIPSYHNCKQSPLKLKPLSFHPPRITLKLILGRTRESWSNSLLSLVSITTVTEMYRILPCVSNLPQLVRTSHFDTNKDTREFWDFSFGYRRRNILFWITALLNLYYINLYCEVSLSDIVSE